MINTLEYIKPFLVFDTYDTFYDLQATTINTDFEGLNLGSFLNTEVLLIKGAQNKVHKCGTDDIINGNLFYYHPGMGDGMNSINIIFVIKINKKTTTLNWCYFSIVL